MDANPKKLAYLQEAVRPLRKYCGKLAENLLRNRVPIPPKWLTAQQQAFVALADGAILTSDDLGVAEQLVPLVIGLCSVLIPRLIDDFVRPRTLLDRDELETLRRGRGPAAVRKAIFRASAPWPSTDPSRLPAHVRLAVDSALDDALAQFRDWRSGIHTAIGTATWQTVAAVVTQYAGKKHLSDEDAAWLLSEVSAQLIRSNDQGLAPKDLKRWTLATAKVKYSHRAHIDVNLHLGPQPDLGRLDDGFAHAELAITLKKTGAKLAEMAARLRAANDLENAAIYKVSAAVLQAQPVERIVAFLKHESWVRDAMAAELSAMDLDLHPAGLTAAADIVKATLRDALRDCSAQPAPDASA